MKRLGLDIGSKSIGWAMLDTNTNKEVTGLVDLGVRMFSDGRHPKTGSSRAAERREHRSPRRMRDRYLRRRAALMRKLVKHGLMPDTVERAKSIEGLDPFRLRARGLVRKIPLTHFGRAIFHIGQRRGFKSNRKTDKGDNEGTKIKTASQDLDMAMLARNAGTLGEFQHMRRAEATNPRKVPSVRTRLGVIGVDDKGREVMGYQFYPERHHLESEFDRLWEAQAGHHVELTDSLRDDIRKTIFFQRPLRKPQVGKCLFNSNEDRLPKSSPVVQRRILFETINSLHIESHGTPKRQITREQRDKIIHAFDNRKPTAKPSTMKFELKALAKIIKLAHGERFTLQSINRDSIACDSVRASLSHPDRFGPNWSKLDMDAQCEVITRISDVESDLHHIELVEWLESRHGLNKDKAVAVSNAPLPDGYSRLGQTATQQILEKLEDVDRTHGKVLMYSEAVAACGMNHSDGRTGEIIDRLPYYGKILERHVMPGTGKEEHDDITRYGRITNPSVHIGLNQLRRLVNTIIDRYGLPDEIVVEFARELKQSRDQKIAAQKQIKKNRENAEKRGKKLRDHAIENNGKNRDLLRLWEELCPDDVMKRRCPYSGSQISFTMLFDGSCEVDHILPRSRTLDDSFANRTLCTRESNREKGGRTPFDAFSSTDRWEFIVSNMENIPNHKRWRFQPDAMERFGDEKEFFNRELNDTQYLSRIAATYLESLYTDKGHVRAVPGRLTGKMRRVWGLNTLLSDDGSKNRNDHRHHAIDAVVVACTDRSLLNRISRASAKSEKGASEKVARSIPEPWNTFRKDLEKAVSSVIVSHRPNRGRIDIEGRKDGRDSTSGGLHEATALGIIHGTEQVVSRKQLSALKPDDIADNAGKMNIRDATLQKALAKATLGKEGVAFERAKKEFANNEKSQFYGLRHIRMISTLTRQSRIEVNDKEGKPFKAYKTGSNQCLELWRMPNGKYVSRVVSTFDAHNLSSNDINKERPDENAKKVLVLFQRDMVALEKDGRTLICYVQKISQQGYVMLAEHFQSNADARHRDKNDPFKFLQIGGSSIASACVRPVAIDVTGQIMDPGREMYH